MLPFIIIGLTTGAIYGLAATGLVLTYKTSGIFNFAQGAIATLAAYVFYFLHFSHHIAWPLAAFIAVFILGPIVGFLFELMARRLAHLPAICKVAATIGVVIAVEAAMSIWYPNQLEVPSYLPTHSVKIGGAFVSYQDMIIIGISLILTVGMYFYFRFARTGIAMRAVVDNADLLDMSGTSARLVRRAAWFIGCTFAALAGVLLAPITALNPTVLTLLVVQAFGAAAIGYFSNLPLTYVGGLVVGIAGSLATKYVGSNPYLQGLPASIPFLILFVALLVTPKSRLAERVRNIVPPRQPWRAPGSVRLGSMGLALVVGLILPSFAGVHINQFTTGLCYVMLFLSLGILVKTAGQISLGQLAFSAVGAAVFAHFSTNLGIPWLIAVLLAGLLTVPVGVILAAPAVRMRGVFLALATYGFAILVEQMFYTTNIMFTQNVTGIAAPRPYLSWLPVNSDRAYYYVVLAFVVVTVAFVCLLERGRLGRLLRAVSEAPNVLETEGATVNVTLVLVFGISAFIAGITGALIAVTDGFIGGGTFASATSLTLLAVISLLQGRVPWYAILGAAGQSVIPSFVNIKNSAELFEVLFGLAAIQVSLQYDKLPGVPLWLRRFLEKVGGGQRRHAEAVSAPELMAPVSALASTSEQTPDREVADGHGLTIQDVSVRFGGILAVDKLSLTARSGRITGLIGPNGAGKTTVFNACSGLVRPAQGIVRLNGQDISRMAIAARAREGLGRTFQIVQLFNTLSVRENVSLGREASLAGRSPITQVVSHRGDRELLAQSVQVASAVTGVTDLLDRPTSQLTTGQRRLVELARCLAGPFDMLLLDEPSSGLDSSETEEFGRAIKLVADQRGCGVLLVEHDMALVRQVCDYVYVMDWGRLIFEGDVDAMVTSEVVRNAYLGSASEVSALPTSPS